MRHRVNLYLIIFSFGSAKIRKSGQTDFEQKSPYDEREPYKRTVSEESAIERKSKQKGEICRISTLIRQPCTKSKTRHRVNLRLIFSFGCAKIRKPGQTDFEHFRSVLPKYGSPKGLKAGVCAHLIKGGNLAALLLNKLMHKLNLFL